MGTRLRTRIGAVAACAAAFVLLGVVGTAHAAAFGANDDTGLFMADGGALYFHQMAAVGLTEIVLTVRFTPSYPTVIDGVDRLDAAVPNAVAAGLKVVFAVYPYPPRELQAGLGSPQAFAAWLTEVATRYPQVKQFTVMNEPNQTAFLRPQFSRGATNVSAATTGVYLAAAYDALKAVDPAIKVIGVGLSPRGNDDSRAPSNVSTSPVRFLEALGRWYRASGRTAPLMDGFSFHPYPVKATDPLEKPYVWPNAGFANLGRIKQALWDAFDGTAQPTTVNGLKLYLDEVGWQVGTNGLRGYVGRENVPVTDAATQAAVYSQLVRAAACDSDIAEVNFFGFYDDPRRSGFQAGLYTAGGVARPSAAAVQAAIGETAVTGCTGVPALWAPAVGVVGATARASGPTTPSAALVSAPAIVSVNVGEGARVTVVLRAVGLPDSALASLLAPGGPVEPPSTSAMIPFGRGELTVAIPRGLAPGLYEEVIRFVAEANDARTTTLDAARVFVRPSP
jgi:hypothetical protein